MIVWLASYPRSGNTLARTVLKQCFDLDSYVDERFGGPTGANTVTGLSHETRREFGALDFAGRWEDFYRNATESAAHFFVGTHLAPRDMQPAIYVVRDGRAAISSAAAFLKRYMPETKEGLLELTMGDDPYGGWSQQYRAWCSEGRSRLLLRYEELVSAPMSTLLAIRKFCGFSVEPRPWVNPFERLHAQSPDFFRIGRAEWDPPADWTEAIDAIFWHIHGPLMEELGYGHRPPPLGELERILVEAAQRAVAEKQLWLADAQAKESVIHALHATCEERLALINELDAALKGTTVTKR